MRAGRPLTALEVHTEGRKVIPRLGLNTVYRQLQELIDQSEVLKVDYPGQPLRFEWATGHHLPHLLCRDCGKVFPVFTQIPDVAVEVPEPFILEGQELILFGRCRLGPTCPHQAREEGLSP